MRCLAADAPAARAWRVGALSLALEDRALTITGLSGEVRIAAFAGPGGASGASLGDAVQSIRAARPHLALVVGDVGDDLATAKGTLEALAAIEIPVLVTAGGRDDATVLGEALDALAAPATDRVVDARALRRIALGRRDVLVPISGAPNGRYGRTDTACGFGTDDLDAVASDVGRAAEGERRFLLSWAAPSGPAARGLADVDAGDPGLAALARRIGAPGGIFAWPRERALEPAGPAADARIVVAPIAGPPVERADGARVPAGPALLVLGPGGLSLAPAPTGGEP